MANAYMTSNALIESVKRRISMPGTNTLFSDLDLLSFADEEMSMGIVPGIQRLREDYLLFQETVTLQSNKSRYEIPYRAIGNKLRDLAFKDTNGNIFEMTRIMIDDLPFYNGVTQSNGTYNYYINNNEIVLVPESQTLPVGFLVISFYIRPNCLVKLDKVGVITAINTTTGEITLSSIPSEFSVSKMYDIVKIKSPHVTLDYDVAPTGLNTVTKTITFNLTDIPSNLEVGDHICLAKESAIPQIPSDLHVLLAHRTAARCLEAMGDIENLQAANAKLGELEKQMDTMIDSRVESSPKIITNRHSTLRNGLYSKRFRR
jgi:hypothetical protein